MLASAKDLCEKAQTPFLADILEEAYSYEYDQKPDYGKLKFLLTKQLLDMDLLPSTKFSFKNNPFLNSVFCGNISYNSEQNFVQDGDGSLSFEYH
jgi:hypothetical protein